MWNHPYKQSLPSRECGLKFKGQVADYKQKYVTPFAGVWIEIHPIGQCSQSLSCHSLRGSVDWNLTHCSSSVWQLCHSLRGSVDWNHQCRYLISIRSMSLPSRECGLKSCSPLIFVQVYLSLPSRECGLKFAMQSIMFRNPLSLPSRECGLKYECHTQMSAD